MPNMTLLIPPELKAQMDEHDEVNWSALARQAFAQYLRDVEMLKRLKGSVKPLTPAQQTAARKRLATMTSEDLFRAFGLDQMPEVRHIAGDENLSAPFARQRYVQGVGHVRAKRARKS